METWKYFTIRYTFKHSDPDQGSVIIKAPHVDAALEAFDFWIEKEYDTEEDISNIEVCDVPARLLLEAVPTGWKVKGWE